MFEHNIQNSRFISESKYCLKKFTDNSSCYCPNKAKFLQIEFNKKL